MRKSLFLIVFLILTGWVFGQKAPIKFGKVPRDDISLEMYKPDPSVEAVVLCEYGKFIPSRFRFQWNIRYKIFKKEGLKRLILVVPVDSKSAVKGKVFNMVDGKVEESDLEKDHMYEERVIGNYTRLRIAPPDAREGSVIDLQFTMRGIPNKWHFQKEIPVCLSELVIPPSQYVSFSQRFIGYEPIDEIYNGRWVAKDMPAFHPEPYISSENNYMTTMYMEVSEIHVPTNGYYENFNGTWDQVADFFYEDNRFGEVLRNMHLFLNDAAEEVQSNSASKEELVCNALNRIREDVSWNKDERLYPNISLREIYAKEKLGNSADLNFLFLALLKKLDIECYPMVISTKDEGMVNPLFPSFSRFNYVVSYVKIGDEFQVIDAADRDYPFGLLNENCLNQGGLVVRKEGGEWVEIRPEKKDKRIIRSNLMLNEDGIIEGIVQIQHDQYAAVSFKKEFDEFTTEDRYLEKFEQKHPGLMVLDYSMTEDTATGGVTERFTIEMDGVVSRKSGMLQLNPIFMDRLTENPFKLEKREYPVDFGYGKEHTYFMSLTLPEGTDISKFPSPVKIITEEKSASYLFNINQVGNMVQIMKQFSINKPVFLQDEYTDLKSLFELVVKKESEQLICNLAIL